ncbi:heterokaryon incompatibility protein-domain-containing protein [Xylaria curta]|nr:heterokaryon incompatibility protein-domain-containing protein [Xylaria curta]
MDDQVIAINAPLELLQEPFVQDRLCSICSKISFRALLDGTCSDQLRREGCPESQGSCTHIKLGTLQRISSTTSYPARRLVTRCISLYYKDLPINRNIYLSCQWVADGPEMVAGREINARDDYESVFCITILVCRHALESKFRQQRSGGPCRLTGIGAILPARPHYRKGDFGSEISCNGSPSDGNLKIPHYAYARYVTPLINIGLVREWIASCTAKHHKCCESRFPTPLTLANIRLVDVQKRQVTLRDMSCRYIALSYVWGPSTTGLLTRATLETFSREGSLGHEDVPRTIRDAISLVADLGERYLWIDSLCIIQDDRSDKRQYLPMMGEIYNAAMMVVVAAVENAHSGLSGRGGKKRQQSRMMETIQGIDFTLGQPELWDYLPTTTWNTRGWTYQEAELSRRAIFITDSQVYWSCCEAYWCEDRFTEFPTQPRASLVNPLFTNCRTLPGNHLKHPVLCPLGEYCQMVTEFSSRSVSDRKDILWAFFGILKSLLSRFPRRYIWGLPKEKLDSALL